MQDILAHDAGLRTAPATSRGGEQLVAAPPRDVAPPQQPRAWPTTRRRAGRVGAPARRRLVRVGSVLVLVAGSVTGIVVVLAGGSNRSLAFAENSLGIVDPGS